MIACIVRLIIGSGLPRYYGGSAPTLDFSEPAQRSLHVTARDWLTLQEGLFPKCFNSFVTS